MGQRPGAVATVIDSQSVKAGETVGKGSAATTRERNQRPTAAPGGRGPPLLVMVTPASPSDRDGAKEVLFRLRLTHPEITIVCPTPHTRRLVSWAERRLNLTFKTVSRPKGTRGFIVLPRRWVVERPLASNCLWPG
ncbi:transposase [Streptomyces sp. NPDC006289]|uniref:transposase n=1 Tax=Streptomyces sp. NPDC006289 TaxID=3156744 RepID=UPI0033A50A8E